MEVAIGELIQGGGAVALAVLVWIELRAFRKEVSDVVTRIADQIGRIGERQAVIYERQRIVADKAGVTLTDTIRAPSNSEVNQ